MAPTGSLQRGDQTHCSRVRDHSFHLDKKMPTKNENLTRRQVQDFTAWRRSLQDQRIYVQQSRQKEDKVPGWPLPNMKGVHIPNCILHSNAAQAPCTLAASLLFSACRRAILQGHRHDQSSHGWASGCKVLYVNMSQHSVLLKGQKQHTNINKCRKKDQT